MNKEFIPYEQALALKELGFDESCFGVYSEHDKTRVYDESAIREGLKIQAPLYQQAFRWFREKHQLHIILDFEQCKNKMWFYTTLNIEYNISETSNETFNSYKETELECLKKLIEIVKLKEDKQ